MVCVGQAGQLDDGFSVFFSVAMEQWTLFWIVVHGTNHQVIQDDITGQIEEPVNGWAIANGFGVSPCPVTLMYGASHIRFIGTWVVRFVGG